MPIPDYQSLMLPVLRLMEYHREHAVSEMRHSIADQLGLAQILEGLVDLRDALKFKIEKAAQEGRAFVSLMEFQR